MLPIALAVVIVKAISEARSVSAGPISASGPFYIQSEADCNFLDLKPPIDAVGTIVVTTPLRNATTQQWDIYDVGAGFMIVNKYNGLAMDIENGGQIAGGRIITWAATFSCNQRWAFESDGAIRSGRNDLVLDVCSPGKEHSHLLAYTWHGGLNQRFRTFIAGSFGLKPPKENVFKHVVRE